MFDRHLLLIQVAVTLFIILVVWPVTVITEELQNGRLIEKGNETMIESAAAGSGGGHIAFPLFVMPLHLQHSDKQLEQSGKHQVAINLMIAERQRQTVTRQVKVVQQIVDDVKERVEQGVALQTDLNLAEAWLSATQLEMLSLKRSHAGLKGEKGRHNQWLETQYQKAVDKLMNDRVVQNAR